MALRLCARDGAMPVAITHVCPHETCISAFAPYRCGCPSRSAHGPTAPPALTIGPEIGPPNQAEPRRGVGYVLAESHALIYGRLAQLRARARPRPPAPATREGVEIS